MLAPMRELPAPARFYILLVFGLGLAIVGVSLPALYAEPTNALIVLGIALAIATLDLYPVLLFSTQSNNVVEVTISVAAKMAAILLVPPPLVILAVFLGTLLAESWQRRAWYKLLFNVGMMTVEVAIVAVLYNFMRDPSAPLLGSAQNLFALAALGLGDFVINSVLVSLVIALATRAPIQYVWMQNYKQLIVHELSMLPIGVFIFILWQYTPWSVVLAALPLFVMRHSYQMVAQLGRQTREALYALARVLDERDELTQQHSEQVAENAGQIARAMGLGPEQVDEIMLAAAMHDIGKVGMRNEILFKPGALTSQERELAKRHAKIGGDLLSKFPLFKRGSVYVRQHHERWDGSGYPDGLKGEEITLGARILAVSDSFQAMTEQRPYREPLTEEMALAQLREGSGTQFDPQVVAAFLSVKGAEPVPDDSGSRVATSSVVGAAKTG